MFGGLGTTELVLILVLAFMIFGVGKLPQVAKMLGSGVNNFKKGLAGEDDEDDEQQAKSDEPELLEEDKTIDSPAGEKTPQPERTESF